MPDVADLVAGAADAGLIRGPGGVDLLHTAPALVVAVTTADGPRVLKAHRPGTDPVALQQRLDLAGAGDPFLAPLPAHPTVVAGRLVTGWPRGEPVDPERIDDVPWAAAAELLAALHRVPPPAGLPAHGAPMRLRRILRHLGELDEPRLMSARRIVETAARSLPPLGAGWDAGAAAVADAPTATGVTHGDFHLGQVVRRGSRWLLIDVDDVGVGDQRWDFAWPAAWFAVGLVTGEAWATLIDTYRTAGGRVVGRSGDPWSLVDGVARCATVHIAARSILCARDEGRDLDELDCAFVDATARFGD